MCVPMPILQPFRFAQGGECMTDAANNIVSVPTQTKPTRKQEDSFHTKNLASLSIFEILFDGPAVNHMRDLIDSTYKIAPS